MAIHHEPNIITRADRISRAHFERHQLPYIHYESILSLFNVNAP